MTLRAILFDLDDTLYPEAQYVESGLRAVSELLSQKTGRSLHAIFNELVTLHKDVRFRTQVFDIWLLQHIPEFEQDKTITTSELVASYRMHDPIIYPFDDALPVLEILSRQYKLGIVSDGHYEVQLRKWKALVALHPFFEKDAVIFSDMLGGREFWKPSPLPYEAALTRLGVFPQEAIYVGDNPNKDFLGARRAGMKSVYLKREKGYYLDNLNMFPPENQPYRIIIHLGELSELLSQQADWELTK